MGKRTLPIFLVLLAVAYLPRPAVAEPNLKETHDCSDNVVTPIGRRQAQIAPGPLLVNEDTSCKIARKAIRHGSVRGPGFRTKGWTCRTQGRFETGGEYSKCRRGSEEAFEFAWIPVR